MGDNVLHEFSDVQNVLEFFVEVVAWNRIGLIYQIFEDAIVIWIQL